MRQPIDLPLVPDEARRVRERLQQTLGGSYTIERELAGGGMSRVFVAEELTLKRRVVIKVLPDAMAGQVSIERFQREIGLAAQLQHPHIVPLLTAGEADGLPFFTMPFIDGESLRGRLTRAGELPIGETVRVLREVASALAYAHDRGVVHRDIKPDNVLITGGSAMVTDFGVAKALSASSHTAGTGLTSAGVALGTPAYMAPEQAAADPHIDQRADIYALGAMAYEMLTGQPPFVGRSHQALLAAHVMETPETIERRRAGMPAPLAQLVMRCLAKRPSDRPQSAKDVILALDSISTPSGGMTPTGVRFPPVRNRSLAIATAATLLVLAGAAYAAWGRHPSFTPFQTSNVRPVAASAELIEIEPTISPDGMQVAYAEKTPAGFRIFIRQVDVDGGPTHQLVTEELAGDQRWPRWSPDGSRILFAAGGTGYVAPSGGGSPRRAITSPTQSVATPNWSPDGSQYVFADSEGIAIQSVTGGSLTRIVNHEFLHSPVWSPDGHHLAYVDGRPRSLGNSSTNAIWVVSLADRHPDRLSDSTHVNTSPAWAPDSKSVLYLSNPDGTIDLFQQPVRGNGRAIGDKHRLFTALGAFTFTLSKTGERMVYDVVHDNTSIWEASIPEHGSAKTAIAHQVTDQDEHIEALTLSADGKWLTYDSNRNGNVDIYKVRVDSVSPKRLTQGAANSYMPGWSPDGNEIAYHATRSGPRHIYAMNADGTDEVQVTSGTQNDFAPRWSPDGHSLVFMSQPAGTDLRRLFVVTRDANRRWSAPRQISPDGIADARPLASWSPDGKRIAFSTDHAVLTVPQDGGPAQVLADEHTLGGSPSDLSWVANAIYVRVMSEPARIAAIPSAGGPARTILEDDARHPFAWVGFASDGHRIFFTLAPRWESGISVMTLKR